MEGFSKTKASVRTNSNLNVFYFIIPVFVLMLQLFKSYKNKEFITIFMLYILCNLKINTISGNTEIMSCPYCKWVSTLLRHQATIMPLKKKTITFVAVGKLWKECRMVYREENGDAFGAYQKKNVNFVLFTHRRNVIK